MSGGEGKQSNRKRSSPRRVTANGRESAKIAADQAVAVAQAEGAIGAGDHGKLDSHQLALRDTAIMARLHEGASRSAVAAEFAISRQAVDGVVVRWHKARSPLEGKPMETIDWLADVPRDVANGVR